MKNTLLIADKPWRNKNKGGFTLVEALVFLFIFVVTVVTFYQTMVSGMLGIIDAKKRLAAVAVAVEKMETVRNLNYDKIGTVGGVPAGSIAQNETVVRSGITFFVNTVIQYVDDPLDKAGTADPRTDDYKNVKIRVFWENNNESRSVLLASSFAPPGVEAVFAGGILSINVINSLGKGIPQASVHLVNSSVSPVVNANYQTDNNGNVFLPGSPVANQTYSIEVEKDGYYSVKTYASSSGFTPSDVHASVAQGAINQKTIITDKISDIIIKTQNPMGDSISNVSFGLIGGKKIGDTVVTSPAIPEAIYDYSEDSLNSGDSGEKTLQDMSSGSYVFNFNNPTSDYEFLWMNPAVEISNKFDVLPDVTLTESAVLAEKEKPSLLVTVLDNNDNSPIENASVKLKQNSPEYDVTLTTNKFGQAYFPDATAELIDGPYDLTVESTNYQNYSDSITVDNFTKKEIKISP